MPFLVVCVLIHVFVIDCIVLLLFHLPVFSSVFINSFMLKCFLVSVMLVHFLFYLDN